VLDLATFVGLSSGFYAGWPFQFFIRLSGRSSSRCVILTGRSPICV